MTSIVEMEGTWEEIAARASEFAGHRVRVMVLPKEPEGSRRLTARELLRLPLAERDRILAKQAEDAEPLYRDNPELTDFEASGDEDLFDATP